MDRLYHRYLKGTKFEQMDLVQLAMILDYKNIIRLVEAQDGLFRYEQVKNISRQDFLNLMKERL